jgi:quinol monooxygenase YgiN
MRTLITLVAALFLTGCCGKTNKDGGDAAAPAAMSVTKNETGMIRLNVFVETTPENLAAVVEGLNALAAASRAEEGCERYDIFQNTTTPTGLMIVETWASEAALAAHQKTPHYQSILPALGKKMTSRLERFDY